jgi:t-SNARE complex subunit (syntaxin)
MHCVFGVHCRSRQREVVDAVSSQCEDLEAKVHQQEVQYVSVIKSLEARYVQLCVLMCVCVYVCVCVTCN